MEVTRQDVAYITLADREIGVFVSLVHKVLTPPAGFTRLNLTDEEQTLLTELYSNFADPDRLQPLQAITAEVSTHSDR